MYTYMHHICTTVPLIHTCTTHMYHCNTYTCMHYQTYMDVCTMYTYMHHTYVPLYHLYINAPQNTTKKIRVYLVGLPSVLCEKPNAKGRSVLNQLFLMISGAFHVLFMKSVALFTKSAACCEKCNTSRKVVLFMKSTMLFTKSIALFMKSTAFYCKLLGYHQV